MILVTNGDVLRSGADIICHQVNCQGVMGSGVAKQIRDKYPSVYRAYKQLSDKFADRKEMLLGNVLHSLTGVDSPVIANCFAQLDYGVGKVQTDYEALRHCFSEVLYYTQTYDEPPTIAMPYGIGCGLAGGDWEIVSGIIRECFEAYQGTVYLYAYGGQH